MNVTWARKLLETFHANGVREVVFCAGARNSPLVFVLEKAAGIEAYSFFEERSAAFFALGIARRTERPVAVITTSGTAAAELLPATIEAFHLGIPLLLVTADRPKRLRGTGAPQAIDQTGLFAKFIEHEYDLEMGELPQMRMWTRRQPLHVNVCFDEPLIDEPIETFEIVGRTSAEEAADVLGRVRGASRSGLTASAEWAALRLTRFLRSQDPLLVVVGSLESDDEREAVLRFLTKLRAPVYLEGTSGLRERSELAPFALRSGDRILPWGLKEGALKRALRIGGVPTARIWRDLEEPSSHVEILSISPLPFAGLSRGEFLCAEIASALDGLGPIEVKPSNETWFAKDRHAREILESLYREFPKAEPSLFHTLSTVIPSNAHVYVGNSLPIREWDLAASYDHARAVEANRGVNGIDGQVSTFCGGAYTDRENWAIIGDLTAMYDLAGPWAIHQRSEPSLRLVVVNNGGGRIFGRIFKSSAFENRHDFGFEHWAKQWKLGYEKWTSVPAKWSGRDKHVVIELVPDEEQTTLFWDRYDAIFAKSETRGDA
ncbi:MAG: 2-succinyl-5-enolpyruvyl-6-hydroxy-3-cyclohexene-1-carboxylic-acid synthase [Bdellovibrionota bacterium]